MGGKLSLSNRNEGRKWKENTNQKAPDGLSRLEVFEKTATKEAERCTTSKHMQTVCCILQLTTIVSKKRSRLWMRTDFSPRVVPPRTENSRYALRMNFARKSQSIDASGPLAENDNEEKRQGACAQLGENESVDSLKISRPSPYRSRSKI